MGRPEESRAIGAGRARELERLAAAHTSPKAKKAVKAWIGEGFQPALCYASPAVLCPLGEAPCGGDVKLAAITAQAGPGRERGYNIREESLTGHEASVFHAPAPVALRHVLTAAALFLPFTLSDWYPLELEERWAVRHAGALEELRADGPLTEPDPARRRELHERALAELKPARSWFLLKELTEPGDVLTYVDGSGRPQSPTCCVRGAV